MKAIIAGIPVVCMMISCSLLIEKSKTELCNELREQHGIAAVALWKDWVDDYVVTNRNTVVFIGSDPDNPGQAGKLYREYNPATGQTIPVAGEPLGENLTYDGFSNTIHMTIYKRLLINEEFKWMNTYHILDLRTYSRKSFCELGSIDTYAYDAANKKLYYVNTRNYKQYHVFDMQNNTITHFDFPEEMANIDINQIRGVSSHGATGFLIEGRRAEKETENGYSNGRYSLQKNEAADYYGYFDIHSLGFLLSSIEVDNRYTDFCLAGDGRFLCINQKVPGKFESISEIIELDLPAGTTSVIALKDFPHYLGNLKPNVNGGYSFLAYADTGVLPINDSWRLFCNFAAPPENYDKNKPYEGKTGYEIEKNKNLKNRLPVIVQAGTCSGVTSIAPATNGWGIFDERQKLLANSIRFYRVKKN